MRERGWGRIVGIGSLALARPFPGSAAYVAGKGAMLGYVRSLAQEWGRDGITANLVVPGWIPVERHAATPEHLLAELARDTPAGRPGVPADIAAAVLFLCSDLAAFVNGVELPVHGGIGGAA
jgi:3-oxoacyl-[acyl-carrier protein] reductase